MKYRKVLYAEANYGDEEINAVVDVLRNQRHCLVTSKHVDKFEKSVAEIFGKRFGLMVNSGSSANLLALAALDLSPGGEVITPALTFSTTVAPLIQNGLVPVFTDVNWDNLQADLHQVKASISSNTVAIMVPNLIGNIPDWEVLGEIAKEHNLLLIEDSCDTIGYKFNGQFGNEYSHVVTSSFYASHIITGAGTGGIVCFDDEKQFMKAKSLRSWGRRSSQYGETEDVGRRLSCQLNGFDYDDKYVFDDLGYNFVPSEISAAFALEQFKKLHINIERRQKNFLYLESVFSNYKDMVKTFTPSDKADVNWLAFPICLQGKLNGKRKELQRYLEDNGIQTRTIFTGNIVKHPLLEGKQYRVATPDLEVASNVMKNGILLGCHNSLVEEDLDYIAHHFSQFVKLHNG